MISGTVEQRRQRLDQQCTDTFKTAYRPNTLRNYKSKSNAYLRFCYFYGLEPFLAPEWQLVRYARYLANGLSSYDSVKGYVSAVKRLHELGGFGFPSEIHLLRLELRAIQFELVHEIKKAVPVTPQLLVDIYRFVRFVNIKIPVQLVCYVALVVGFTLFLRKSHLVPDTEGSFNSKEQLTRGHVWRSGVLTFVDVEWTKNNQYKKRQLTLPLVPAKNRVVCPKYWVTYLLEQIPGKSSQPLFTYWKKGRMVPLTYDVLAKNYQEWVKCTGRNPEGFTLHGLRWGGTNHAITAGILSEDVKLMGDWVSLAYLEYIDISMERRITNMVRFVDHVDEQIKGACEQKLDL